MRVGIDLDGCAYDFVEAFRSWLVMTEDADPAEMPPATRWDFYTQWGMTLDEFLHHFADGVDAGHIFLAGAPMKNTAWALEALHGMGHTVHIVTDRALGRRAKASTAEWLDRHGLRHDSLTFTADKTVVRCDAFIDDKPENVEALRSAGCNAVLRDQPWNRHAYLPRVGSWGDFLLHVELLADAPEESILQEAQRLVHGDRGVDYGHPADDFARTGRMWGAILGIADVAPDRVGLCMAALKISREVNAHKRDNLTDLAGYAETVKMVHERGAA